MWMMENNESDIKAEVAADLLTSTFEGATDYTPKECGKYYKQVSLQ